RRTRARSAASALGVTAVGRPAVILLAPDVFGTGGIERATRTMLHALSRRYGEEHVGLLSVWGGERSGIPNASLLYAGPQRGPKALHVPINTRAKFLFRALGSACELRRRPAVVVAVHTHLAPVAWAASAVSGLPFVVWCMGREAWTLRPLHRAAVRRASAVLAISHYTAARVTAQVASAPVEVVHLGLDASFHPAPDGERLPHLVLTVSRLVPGEAYKGVDTL